MSLERALDALIGSAPFERLLLERARPILARAEAGEDFLVAALARGLDAPVLAVTPGPREAEALAGGVESYLGPAGVALLLQRRGAVHGHTCARARTCASTLRPSASRL